MLVLVFSLSGCQIVDMLWPNTDLQEVAELLPDDADLQELEQAIDEMETELEEVGSDEALAVTVSPITNSFTLHYKYEAEAVAFNGTAEETFDVFYTSDYSTGSPIKMIFPFTRTFDGVQNTTVAGLNAGVPCFVKLKSDVEYLVMGQFLPDTCEFNFIFNGELEDMNISENTCLEYANALDNYPTFFSPPPDKMIVIKQENEIVFLDPYHSVWLTDIKFGYTVDCPMK
jgi:hypothetical protein